MQYSFMIKSLDISAINPSQIAMNKLDDLIT